MARPVNANADETRRRVLSSACQLFAQNGVRDTSIRQVAREAGVSLGAVHHYFGSKAELRRRCVATLYGALSTSLHPVAEVFDEALDELRAAGDTGAALETLLDRVIRDGFRFAREHDAALRLLMRGVAESGELDPEWRARAHLVFLDQTSRALAPMLGRPVAELRLLVQSVIALGMRYAVASPLELALMTGVAGADATAVSDTQASEALARIADHLVAVGQALFKTAPPGDSDGGRIAEAPSRE